MEPQIDGGIFGIALFSYNLLPACRVCLRGSEHLYTYHTNGIVEQLGGGNRTKITVVRYNI